MYTQYIHVYIICDFVCAYTFVRVHINRAPWEPTSREHISATTRTLHSRLQSVAIPNASSTEKHLGHKNLQSYPDLSSYLIIIYNHD